MEKPNVDFRLTVAGAMADDDILVAEIHVIFNDPVLRIASSLSNFLSSSPSQHLFRTRPTSPEFYKNTCWIAE